MDGKESSILKMDQKKRINLSKIDKFFKVSRKDKAIECLDVEASVILGIIKVEVRLTDTVILPDLTKTESNNCL